MENRILCLVNAALMMIMLVPLSDSAQAQNVSSTPVFFVFGDSLVDPGNNNYITTLAKANFPPNGIDFPLGATGRFCNGRTVADVISQKVGVPYVPAYLNPNTQGFAILGGVNYASAAGGILDATGANYGGRISMNRQIQQFQNTQQQFIQQLGSQAANQVFAKALYFFVMGSNDYINNYLQPRSRSSASYNPKAFEALLVREYSQQLVRLYNLGARKFGVFNVGPLGCIPSQLNTRRSPDGKCIKFINEYVKGFNAALNNELSALRVRLPNATFIYGKAYDLVVARVNFPAKFGLTVVNEGCCGIGRYKGAVACVSGFQPCANREEYLFWDPFHPTDAVNEQLGNAFYSGGSSAIIPMNIKQLIAAP
ncbi:hypothetical protein R1flu_020874 [Riccia fluitans]|uniref:GDSL esterase/lipase n=1 Tax=Riccia fluitans TaxID=41844 RepID=A0ABD1ZPS8_9MARC